MKKVLLMSVLALGFSISAQAGVKEVYAGGSKAPNGSPIYIIKCTGGSSYSAYKASNGFWKDGSGFNYGERYRYLSLQEFAQKKCNY